MTLAEHFKAEGLQQGEQKGKQRKAFEIAKKKLEAKIDLQTIKNCTGLSDQETSRL